MQKIKELIVSVPQGHAGHLVRESQIVFNYATSDPSCEISLTMPLRAQSYAANILPGVMRQNLPEGYLLNWMKQTFGKAMKLDDFNLLALTGREMIGRVQCRIEGAEGHASPGGESLTEILSYKGTEDLFESLAIKYASRSGISGVQPKVVVPQKERVIGEDVFEKSIVRDRNLIVKAAGADYDALAENEYHCMSIAKQAGLIVPQFWLSEDRSLFVIERFDLDGRGSYLGFEDMTALMGMQNDAKYDSSYEMVAKAISMFVAPKNKIASLDEFFRSVVLSIVLRNGDAHLKNFGILYTHPYAQDAKLSPLYDVVNTTMYLPKDALALKMNKTKSWPTRKQLIDFGKIHCLLDSPAEIIDSMCAHATAYVPDFEETVWGRMDQLIQTAAASISPSKKYGGAVN
jgi:serine/threonine-protein kinase HipA